MCGIFAILDFESKNIKHDTLIGMSKSLIHRGPDDCGLVIFELFGGRRIFLSEPLLDQSSNLPLNGFLVLGHRRLSVIDLSEAGHQPMWNETGEIWITYNGEIYNYLELTDELVKRGHQFKSKTDTEVILHAYEEWGIDCLNRFNGMWAFVLWDKNEQRLFCSRDRFGIKPLYYFFDGHKFEVASEIKTLLQDSEVGRIPNHSRIYDYLEEGFLDHTEETCFKNIFQLRGAHYLILELRGTQIHHFDIKQYWDIEIKEGNGGDPLHVKFFKLFEDSIRLHMRSDVPVGTCLSGGLDSSSIVVVSKKFLDSNIYKTFSSCFEDKGYDEREFINVVSESTGNEAHYIFPRAEDLFKEINALVWHQDEPFGSTSIYAQWNVFKLIKSKHVKVVLDGQGGDELLGGYHTYFGAYLGELLKKLQLYQFIKEVQTIKDLHRYSYIWLIRYLVRSMISLHTIKMLKTLLSREIKWLKPYKTLEKPLIFPKKFNNLLFDNLYQSLVYYTLPSYLHYEDRNSMAHSTEARVPFLDYRLVEFVFSLPMDQLIKNGMTKKILREAMKGLLPEKVRTRSGKMGYTTPENIWFRGPLKKEIEDILESKSFAERGYFNIPQIKKTFKDYCEGKINLGSTVWRWVNLELWFRTFIDRRIFLND